MKTSDYIWLGVSIGFGTGWMLSAGMSSLMSYLDRKLLREAAEFGWSCKELLDFLGRNK